MANEDYFDYVNKYIDNLSDEDFLKLLYEQEVDEENLYDTESNEYYDFDIVDPLLVNNI